MLYYFLRSLRRAPQEKYLRGSVGYLFLRAIWRAPPCGDPHIPNLIKGFGILNQIWYIMIIDIEKFEKLGKKAINRAKKENEIYIKYLIPFAKKIGLYKSSKNFEESAHKAIMWEKEKVKYKVN